MSDFAHRLTLDTIRDGERMDLVADDGERAAVAARLGLRSLDRLEAHVTLERDGAAVRAQGRIRAALEQSCVATGDPVAELVDESFEILFVPEPSKGDTGEEVELATEECDLVFYDGACVDLGAAVADTLALSIEPYPRSASAEAALKEAGVIGEAEAGPFAALARLKIGSGEA